MKVTPHELFQAVKRGITDEVLTGEELCSRLKIEASSLKYLTKTKQIPSAKVGNTRRYIWSEIVDWLKKGGTQHI